MAPQKRHPVQYIEEEKKVSKFEAGLDGVTFTSKGCRLLGGFYKAAGDAPLPTAVLLHGLPGIEKHLDIAYRLRDLGWNCLYFHFRSRVWPTTRAPQWNGSSNIPRLMKIASP
jgi:predicted alpha/beta-fold hydrolase